MNFALRIPDYYRKDIELLKGDISINQFIINAIAEKIWLHFKSHFGGF